MVIVNGLTAFVMDSHNALMKYLTVWRNITIGNTSGNVRISNSIEFLPQLDDDTTMTGLRSTPAPQHRILRQCLNLLQQSWLLPSPPLIHGNDLIPCAMLTNDEWVSEWSRSADVPVCTQIR